MLNQKQTVFVYEYLKSGNATAAYKIAYGTENEAAARSNASRLITNDNILAEIERFKKGIMHNTGITIETVVKRINDLAENAERDSDKLKANDLLLKHLGGYYTLQDIIERLTPEQVEELSKKILANLKTDSYEPER